MREVAWVVYDEIHYMRDKERGVVWEETLILIPSTVRFVFLSATIPNALQFAEWICHLHMQPCHVVYTEMRPTPLQHYVFGSGGEGIHLVLDEKKNFREDNLTKAMQSISDKERGVGGHESRTGKYNFFFIKKIYKRLLDLLCPKICILRLFLVLHEENVKQMLFRWPLWILILRMKRSWSILYFQMLSRFNSILTLGFE